jgi:hypothetical protein
MINLFDGTGRHLVDPGPTFNVHLPIFEEPGIKTKLNELEYGEELEFFTTNGARQSTGEIIDGKSTNRLEVNDRREQPSSLDGCKIQETGTYKPDP